MMRSLRALWLSAAALLVPLVGCGGSSDSASDDLTGDPTQSIAFDRLNVENPRAPAGLAILKSTSKYKDFFGDDPPESVDFRKQWVVSFAMGMQSTGGYDVGIDNISKEQVGSGFGLVVEAHTESPGDNCRVTRNITNPQITVVINKQPNTATGRAISEDSEVDCTEGACSVDADCVGGTQCNRPECEPGGPCPSGTCGLESGRCFADGDCSSGERCAVPQCDPRGPCPIGTCLLQDDG